MQSNLNSSIVSHWIHTTAFLIHNFVLKKMKQSLLCRSDHASHFFGKNEGTWLHSRWWSIVVLVQKEAPLPTSWIHVKERHYSPWYSVYQLMDGPYFRRLRNLNAIVCKNIVKYSYVSMEQLKRSEHVEDFSFLNKYQSEKITIIVGRYKLLFWVYGRFCKCCYALRSRLLQIL